jgi:hypothetical protein
LYGRFRGQENNQDDHPFDPGAGTALARGPLTVLPQKRHPDRGNGVMEPQRKSFTRIETGCCPEAD